MFGVARAASHRSGTYSIHAAASCDMRTGDVFDTHNEQTPTAFRTKLLEYFLQPNSPQNCLKEPSLATSTDYCLTWFLNTPTPL